MNNGKNDYGPFIDGEQPSLAGALARLASDPNVADARLKRVRSAVKSLSTVLGRSADAMPAHLRWLNDQFAKLEQSGLARQTVANIKTEIRFAVRTAFGQQSRSAMPKLTADWQELYDRLDGLPLQWQLSRFLRYLSGQDVAPSQVNDAHAAAFRDALVESGEVREPVQRWRATVRAWQRAAETVSGWPTISLNLPPNGRRRWTLHESDFAAAFRTDVTEYLARQGRANLRAEDGPRRASRPATLRHRRHQIYKLASAAVFAGTPVEDLQGLADLLELTVFTGAAEHLLARQEGMRTEALHNLVGAFLPVAKYHVRFDDADLDNLRAIHRALEPEEEALRVRTRTRMRQFDDDRNVARIVHLPHYLFALAKRHRSPSREQPVLAQMAIALAILQYAPMRIGNLAGLNLERHVRQVVIDGEARWLLTIPGEEVKNRVTNTYEIPGEDVQLIDTALALYDQPNGYIFPGRNGGAKATSFLSQQIKDTIARYAGLDVNSHLFRALIARHHLRRHPGAFEDVRTILHDRDGATVRAHYTIYSDQQIIRHVQDSVLATRQGTVNPYVGKRRRRLLGGVARIADDETRLKRKET